jgi:tRNA pseudouridine38-40 synthase
MEPRRVPRPKKVPRIKLTIAYDGTAYHGWQKQKSGAVTVQSAVEEALGKILGTAAEITGASRTDAGVHALGQVAHFDAQSNIPPERFREALNGVLPPDVRIMKSELVPDYFNARFDAVRKTYRYLISNAETENPLERLHVHHYLGKVDAEPMKSAARHLLGRHDFISFMKEADPEKDTVREIYRADVAQEGNRISIEIEGNGFLYNMVRAIAGTLIEVGGGRKKPEWVRDVIAARDRCAAGPTLPAKGLCLVEIKY